MASGTGFFYDRGVQDGFWHGFSCRDILRGELWKIFLAGFGDRNFLEWRFPYGHSIDGFSYRNALIIREFWSTYFNI
jgi:hypothetical protein